MILLIDNYDSFSYNLFQMVGAIEPDIRVIRNDSYTAGQILEMNASGIIISPGPGRPEDAGVCIELIREMSRTQGRTPLLGVCLGHQSICAAFGAAIGYAKELMHGKTSSCRIDTQSSLFAGLSESEQVGRYHSLAALEETLPECLRVTARTDDGEIMAVEHRILPIYGIQFHPESILTPHGGRILGNFVEISKKERQEVHR
ncbi:MAG: aminodeoxychorismate/anthranilate synthase component II [Lachnospiraceae bacterium]|nr:aminodeoxychorismate/anthranilate synthase component II [Lachnospiraceae bacterium]